MASPQGMVSPQGMASPQGTVSPPRSSPRATVSHQDTVSPSPATGTRVTDSLRDMDSPTMGWVSERKNHVQYKELRVKEIEMLIQYYYYSMIFTSSCSILLLYNCPFCKIYPLSVSLLGYGGGLSRNQLGRASFSSVGSSPVMRQRASLRRTSSNAPMARHRDLASDMMAR